MKLVESKGNDGRKQKYWIPDQTPDHKADMGIPAFNIELDDLDWDAIKADLHNLLLDRGLFQLEDLTAKPGQLENAILVAVKRRLQNLYIEQARTLKEASHE